MARSNLTDEEVPNYFAIDLHVWESWVASVPPSQLGKLVVAMANAFFYETDPPDSLPRAARVVFDTSRPNLNKRRASAMNGIRGAKHQPKTRAKPRGNQRETDAESDANHYETDAESDENESEDDVKTRYGFGDEKQAPTCGNDADLLGAGHGGTATGTAPQLINNISNNSNNISISNNNTCTGSVDPLVSSANLPCPCMTVPQDGLIFNDGESKPHRTRYGALEARYQQRTGRNDFQEFMARVQELCVDGCPATDRAARGCYFIIAKSLDDYDPSKGSPWALTRYRLQHDRG